MKITTGIVLGALLLTSVAPSAFAQDGGRGGHRGGEGRGPRSDAAQTQATAQAQPQAQPQERGGREGRGGGRGGPSDQRWMGRGAPNPNYRAPQAQQPAPQVQQQAAPGEGRRGGWNRDGNRGDGNRADNNRGDRGQRRDERPNGWNNGQRPDFRGDDRRGDRNNWDRGGRGDQRFDGRGGGYRSQQRFRAPRYRPPVGFYARSWGYGDILPRGWYGDDYRILDFWSYGLPRPPLGYEWIRVGSDVLLVDRFTGQVAEVIQDIFW